MRISVADPEHGRFYEISVTPQWAQRHDNGALVSCGLTIGQDGFTRRMFERLPWHRVRTVSRDSYNHSGCQSSCIRRGDQACRW